MSGRNGYGQRRVRVTPAALEQWLVNGNAVNTNLPDDARFLRLYSGDKGRCYFFVFESETWDPLMEGEEIPELDVEVEERPLAIKIQK